MKILFQMRYSYFGRSGWRSGASNAVEKLLEPSRLAARLWLLRNIALPSLAAQSDMDFHVQVLTSKAMEASDLQPVHDSFEEALGLDRFTIIQRGPKMAGIVLRRRARAYLGPDAPAAVVVLDDDDALSHDFVETLRAEAKRESAGFKEPGDYGFLSFPRGASLVFTPQETGIFARHVPFTNLGLSLVYRSGTKLSPFSVSHRKLDRRHPVRLVDDGRMFYLRAVHGINDSRAQYTESARLDAQETAALQARFPLLETLDTDEFVQRHLREQGRRGRNRPIKAVGSSAR